jgi:hypothetical protein
MNQELINKINLFMESHYEQELFNSDVGTYFTEEELYNIISADYGECSYVVSVF